MIALFGNLFLTLAVLFSFLQSVPVAWGCYRHNAYTLALARPSLWGQTICILIAYLLLTIAFATNDFSIAYVAANSHPNLPLIYRLTAVWGAHEGSILLWVFVLNLWGVAFAFKNSQHALLALTLMIFGIISFFFLCFLLLTSNPFALASTLSTGFDLNPLLQDPGFIIHPPMLYMGYVGFSAAFAISLAALLHGTFSSKEAHLIKQFALTAWCFLTAGIILGSWWAYRVLGWGGFWFWDPVENASLLPWLCGIALIHVLALVEKRNVGQAWAALLAIICFILSLLGTFLVRSGVLVSAHTFASDPERGMFLLLLLAVITTIALVIYTIRLPRLKTNAISFPLASRETMLLVNSALLFVAMLTVLLGTLYPLIIDALHLGTLSVGAPYFNSVMLPFVILCLIFMGITPFLRSTHQLPFSLWRSLRAPSGMTIAHTGFVVLIVGILLSHFLKQEDQIRMRPGNAATLGPYQFFFIDTKSIIGNNYHGIQADFEVIKQTRTITHLYPEKRIYNIRNMVMTKVAIHPGIFRDLYLALGEPLDEHYWSVRIYYKPFIRWIWFGGILMILGGILAIRQSKPRLSKEKRR